MNCNTTHYRANSSSVPGDPTAAHGGTKSAFTNDPATSASQSLTSPFLNAVGPVTIDVWAKHGTEVGFDGWMVQASFNGGAFTNIGQAAWRQNEYNAFLTTTGNPPFTNQRCFTGNYEWTRRVAAIPANNGDWVRVRFLAGSDASVAATGSWLDDISITSSATAPCCKPDGTCVMATPGDCTGVYAGTFNPAADCASAVCTQAAYAEVEPNETRPASTVVNLVTPGDYISGTTTGSSTTAGATSLDQFLVKTPAAAPGIYRHRLTITTTGTEGHTGTIRGFNQTPAAAAAWEPAHAVGAAGTTDSTVQSSQTTSSAPPRMNQWYGFGKQEQLYYRVTGGTATTSPYKATWTVSPVTPANLGPFQPGDITISSVGQGHTTDTDVWVYDSNFNAIDGWGNEDASINGGHTANLTTSTFLKRTYAAGTYYLAVGVANLANNKGSPSDDNTRTGLMLDFPDAVCSSQNGTTGSTGTTVTNVSFAVTDSAGTTTVAASRDGAFDLLWYKLTVGNPCYADVNGDNSLDSNDFNAFLIKFLAQDPYADCNNDLSWDSNDFNCLLVKFLAGCP